MRVRILDDNGIKRRVLVLAERDLELERVIKKARQAGAITLRGSREIFWIAFSKESNFIIDLARSELKSLLSSLRGARRLFGE